jgi:hypothetical protein
LKSKVIWITAIQFDRSGHTSHENIRAVQWRDAESRQQGVYTVGEVVKLIRSGNLVYVSDDAFERTALVRVVDAEPPYIRSWAHGKWENDLLTLPRFDG